MISYDCYCDPCSCLFRIWRVIENVRSVFADYETGNFALSAKTPGLPSCNGTFQHGLTKTKVLNQLEQFNLCFEGLVYNFAIVPGETDFSY